MYDYRMEMIEDVRNWIEENADFSEYTDIDDFREKAYDSMWVDDGVTGNASGSYTFNYYEAAENLVGNWDLLAEAMQEFGCDCNVIAKGEEWADVTIRCYLLGEVLESVIDADDIAEKIEAAQESEE